MKLFRSSSSRPSALVRTALALSVAVGLAVGSAPAFADDTAPPDASATTTDSGTAPADGTGPGDTGTSSTDGPGGDATPPADTGTSDSGTTDSADAPAGDAPTDAPADTKGTDSGTSTGSKGTDKGSATPGPVTAAVLKIATPVTANLAPSDLLCTEGKANLDVGGFEIDGDPCDNHGLIDFDNGPGDMQVDGTGAADDSFFTGGSSENDNPATWDLTGGSTPGKADIDTAWAYSHVVNGTVWAYFGYSNNSTAGGTQDFSLEYNQANPVGGKPVRTVGDLLFHFDSNGSNVLEFQQAYIYTLKTDPSWSKDCTESGSLGAGWCPKDLPAGGFKHQESTSGKYSEGAINISLLFTENGQITCSGTFGTTFLRSAPGSYWTSELKDYVSPLDVTTPSTCASLRIEKRDVTTHALVGGGVYCISPDPRPGESGTQYCIYDGAAPVPAGAPAGTVADGAADGIIDVGAVEPGTYTVEEVLPPPGYLLNPGGTAGNSEEVTLGESASETVTFENPKEWEPLDVSKTATPTYTASYTWDITKQIATSEGGPWVDTTAESPLVSNLQSGDTTELWYRVHVDEVARNTSNYKVAGTIHVANPNDAAVTATISDTIPGVSGETCLVAGDAEHTASVPAGGADYAYQCTWAGVPGSMSGTNTATVTWDRSTYPQTSADVLDTGSFSDSGTAGYAFGDETTSLNKTVTITDDHFTFDPAWTLTWDGTETADNDRVYHVPVTVADGTCSDVIHNTATLTGSDGLTDNDQAWGKVCVEADLVASGIHLESLTRTYPWSIDKATTTPSVVVHDGQATANYQITVTTGDGSDSNWVMTGHVTVTNPNDWVKTVSAVTVGYSGGGSCAPTEAVPVDVPGDGHVDIDFACSFSSQPTYDGTVSATVSWDGGDKSDNATLTPDPADWDVNPVNDTVEVWDNKATADTGDDVLVDTLQWSDVYAAEAHSVTLPYSITFSGDQLPALGECGNQVNIATVEPVAEGRAAALDSDDATVAVCNPYTQIAVMKQDAETHAPLAGATFELFQGDTSLGTAVSGDDGIATFDAHLLPGDYTVKEIQAPDDYDVPINDEPVAVHIGYPDAEGTNFVWNGVMDPSPYVFENPALGQIAIVEKQQFERDPLIPLVWVPSDGIVNFGDDVRYVVKVKATGKKLFHDVTVTDYLPGYNPDDHTTAPAGTKATYVDNTATCTGAGTCTMSLDAATGLLTFKLTGTGQATGDVVGGSDIDVEFVVTVPDMPATPDPDGTFRVTLWNQGYLDWNQVDFTEQPTSDVTARFLAARVLASTSSHHHLASNEVVVRASFVPVVEPPVVSPPQVSPPEVSPPEAALPNTGGPDMWLAYAGFALLLGGAALVLAGRRHRHRS